MYLKRILFFTYFLGLLVLIVACNDTNSKKPAKKQPKKSAKNKNPKSEPAFKRPNIVILLADDLGWNDVGYHNKEIKTPNIDQLAEEGMRLNRFYVSNVCTPSRIALMTGRYPGRFGLTNGVLNPNRKEGLPPEEYILPELLAEAGYDRRACIGKWHMGHAHIKYHPVNQGFSHFYGHYGGQIDYFTHKRRGEIDWHRNFETSYDNGYSTDLIAEESVKFIMDAKPEEPFFLYVPFNCPHTPLQAKEEDLVEYDYNPDDPKFASKDDNEIKLPNGNIVGTNLFGRGNSKRQTYSAMISSMDQAIGRILDALDQKDISNNTIVLFYSDNGAHYAQGGSNKPLKGEKGTVFEGGVRAPAVIRWPDRGWTGGKVIEDMLGHIDIFPTLQKLLKINENPFKQIDGTNVLGILDGTQKEVPERYFYLGRKALATNRWKLVKGKLYDMKTDMVEKNDISKEKPNLYKRLIKKLDQMRKEIEVEVEPDNSFEVQPEWKMPDY